MWHLNVAGLDVSPNPLKPGSHGRQDISLEAAGDKTVGWRAILSGCFHTAVLELGKRYRFSIQGTASGSHPAEVICKVIMIYTFVCFILPAGTAGRAGSSAGRVSLPVQLLLRPRRMQEEDDTAVGAFSRQKGLPRCRGDLDQRHAPRSNAASGPRAFDALWC